MKAELAKKEAEAKQRFLEKRRLKTSSVSATSSESPQSSSPLITKAELPDTAPDVPSPDTDLPNVDEGSESGEIEDDELSTPEPHTLTSKVPPQSQSQIFTQPNHSGSKKRKPSDRERQPSKFSEPRITGMGRKHMKHRAQRPGDLG